MNSTSVGFEAQDSLLVVCTKILDQRISSLLVIDSTNEPIGIITTDDLLREMQAMLTEAAADEPGAIDTTFLKIGLVAQKIANTCI